MAASQCIIIIMEAIIAMRYLITIHTGLYIFRKHDLGFLFITRETKYLWSIFEESGIHQSTYPALIFCSKKSTTYEDILLWSICFSGEYTLKNKIKNRKYLARFEVLHWTKVEYDVLHFFFWVFFMDLWIYYSYKMIWCVFKAIYY